MNPSWSVLKIKEVAEVIGGGTPSTKVSEYWGEDIPWISPKDLTNHKSRYISRGEKSITHLGLEKSSARLLPVNSLLFSSRAPIGYLAISSCPLSTNQGFKSLVLKEGNSVEFFYYLLKCNVKKIQNLVTGSTFSEISGSEVKELKFPIPPIYEQKAIAHFLGILDDKIELNEKMSQTLEKTAKTLFKSWFIKFEPVRAKAEGRPTGLPKEISDLFPDSFEDSELGEIPKDWKLSKLKDHIIVIKGKSYKSSELQESETALVTLKSFRRNGGYRMDGLKPYIGSFKDEQIINEGDLIVAFTDVTQAADVIGKPAIVIRDKNFNRLIASLDVGIIKINQVSLLSQSFLYNLMLTNRYTQNSLSYTSGTTVLHLNKEAITDFLFAYPPKSLLEIFIDISSNVLEKISLNHKENNCLSELRDTLLPKLISGELKIHDAKKFLEQAGL